MLNFSSTHVSIDKNKIYDYINVEVVFTSGNNATVLLVLLSSAYFIHLQVLD